MADLVRKRVRILKTACFRENGRFGEEKGQNKKKHNSGKMVDLARKGGRIKKKAHSDVRSSSQ